MCLESHMTVDMDAQILYVFARFDGGVSKCDGCVVRYAIYECSCARK